MWFRHTHGRSFIGYSDNIDRKIPTLFNDICNKGKGIRELPTYIQVRAWSKQPVLGIEPGPRNWYNQWESGNEWVWISRSKCDSLSDPLVHGQYNRSPKIESHWDLLVDVNIAGVYLNPAVQTPYTWRWDCPLFVQIPCHAVRGSRRGNIMDQRMETKANNTSCRILVRKLPYRTLIVEQKDRSTSEDRNTDSVCKGDSKR